MTTTTERSARTRRGEGYASVGAVAQRGGSLPVYICNTCGSEVAWATSSRTGRKYLANVRRGQAGQRYYIAASVHDCAPVLAAVQADRDHLDAQNRQLALFIVGALRSLVGHEPEPFLTGVSMPADTNLRGTVGGWSL